MLRNISFGNLKTTIFNESFLHARIFRHIFEYGCSIVGMSTLYTVFRYKKEYLDPLKSKSVSPNAVTTSKTTLKPYTSQKPSLHRIGHLKENFANKSNHSQSDELHPLIAS